MRRAISIGEPIGLDHEAELVVNPLKHTISGAMQRKTAEGKTP
jgi:hypothetical protein